ncbi:MAG: AAA family ATPase [Veillonella sp.]|uniref:AAA family ATPase n=1 Tax=Veillonella sp. TaxID=1926307 RepID=UPI0025D1D119|nr:AAA family ATPase [Veillonella sp.]MBS4914266.1 AAA family ATPase [Veillonella sp.]
MNKSTVTAKQIYRHMQKYVKGQDSALKQLSTLIAWHVKRCQHNTAFTNEKVQIKENAFIIGSSGTGKTETFRALAEFKDLPCPVVTVNACDYMANGWKGDKSLSQIMEPVILKAMEKAGESDFNFGSKDRIIPIAETAILCIDEFDKKRMDPNLKADYKFPEHCFQSELLKMVEGNVINGSVECVDIQINTANILFILMGSFHELQNAAVGEDKQMIFKNGTVSMEEVSKWERKNKITDSQLIQYGLMEELVGRVPWRIRFDRLHHADLMNIMAEAKHSVIKEYVTLLNSAGNTLEVSEDGLFAIAEEALQRGTGARAVASIFMELMRPVMFELMNRTNMHVYVGGEEVVNRNVKMMSKRQWNRRKRSKELENKDLEGKEVASKEVASKEVANKEVANKEVTSKEIAHKEIVSKEPVSGNTDTKMDGDKENEEFRYQCESIDYTRFFDDSQFIPYRVDDIDKDKASDTDKDKRTDKDKNKDRNKDKGKDSSKDKSTDKEAEEGKHDGDGGTDGSDGTTKAPK